jgi:hypothetical protein
MSFSPDNDGRFKSRPLCPDCKCEMDPDWCWCGDAEKDHKGMSHNHSFVPMGCQCGYASDAADA